MSRLRDGDVRIWKVQLEKLLAVAPWGVTLRGVDGSLLIVDREAASPRLVDLKPTQLEQMAAAVYDPMRIYEGSEEGL